MCVRAACNPGSWRWDEELVWAAVLARVLRAIQQAAGGWLELCAGAAFFFVTELSTETKVQE